MNRFFRSASGVTTIEFAIIAPIFIFLIGMSLEVGRVQVATMLLERAIYDISHQTRIKNGSGLQGIAAAVLKERSYSLFDPEKVTVTAWSAPDIQSIAAGGAAGSGGAADIVHLQLQAELSLFGSFVPEPMKVTRIIDYYYMNEPELVPR